MSSFLERELATLAFCWRAERRDGVCLGFTSHDRDLAIDGLVYRAAPGMLPSAVSVSDDFDASTLDVSGALTSDSIGEADLAAGRWDRALLSLFLVDWEDAEGGRLHLARGELGDVTVRANGFEAELRGAAALLERAVAEQTSPECRAELGDRRCRVDMAGRVRTTRVTAAPAEGVVVVEVAAGGAFAFGRLRWIGGANSGLESLIVASEGSELILREAPPFAIAEGDRVELREGCDKSFATCRARFANAENFRGEPHLPGMDLLTRYPGA
ncbi:MAG TPA: DUF2163 domain-containing protein [Allosphingosinicella sp.]|jgi:uncharacterized phage protein (TIGR02218 family)|nr:DUF2163 domain-containing protein [Allosphingosinicella sp.]